jgi:hypothetical protein
LVREPNKDKTSLGQQSMQIVRAAESLGYNPENLSRTQHKEIWATLHDPVQSIFLTAKHLSDLREIGFEGISTLSNIEAIGARYNQGRIVQEDDFVEAAKEYGRSITRRLHIFDQLLSPRPNNSFIHYPLHQEKSTIYRLYRGLR